MTKSPYMIGVAGTHSTGKSTFVQRTSEAAEAQGLRVGRIGDLATKARSLGFPILSEHTYESTLWIMANGMRQEMEALLHSDVVIVDRPVPDALGYLYAALEVSKRQVGPDRLDELKTIAVAHANRYDLLVVTVLDLSIALGPDRDTDAAFRAAAAKHVTSLIDEVRPDALKLTSQNVDEVIATTSEHISRHLGTERS